MTVSYTHLEVYKRQSHSSWTWQGGWSRTRSHSVILSGLFPCTDCRKRSIKAVSYTHLEIFVAEVSPMMQHYLQTKEQYKDCILFYRLGDFYEMFFDDAIMVSKELELTLTGKNCGLEAVYYTHLDVYKRQVRI